MTFPDPVKAEEYLSRLGYYRLSGHWYQFRAVHTIYIGHVFLEDFFKPRTEFKTIVDLYAFDKKLRLIMLDAIERIELSVRTQVALTLGKIDPLAHRDPANFDARFITPVPPKPSQFQDWLSRLDSKASTSKEEYADHFRAKYSSPMPIWIAVELLDFGPLSILLSGMKFQNARDISRSFGLENPHYIKSWIRSISVVRNVCAHHARLWNRAVIDQPSLMPKGSIGLLDHLHDVPGKNARLYAVLSIIWFLLKKINPRTEWDTRLKDHIQTFPKHEYLSLASAGFPDDWLTQPLWQ